MVGLFFGSFNPIHRAHIAIAQYLVDEGICSSVRFVISPCNPFKQQGDLLDERLRLRLAEMSLADDSRLSASDVEFDMPRPSYTIDTLRRIQAKEPAEKFALIMGGDNLRVFHQWKSYRSILESFHVLVYPRPNEDLSRFEYPNVQLVDAPLLPISATEIRRRISVGESVSALVMPSAEKMIVEAYRSFLKK